MTLENCKRLFKHFTDNKMLKEAANMQKNILFKEAKLKKKA